MRHKKGGDVMVMVNRPGKHCEQFIGCWVSSGRERWEQFKVSGENLGRCESGDKTDQERDVKLFERIG